MVDPELTLRLIRSRCEGSISDEEYAAIARGLAVADQDEPEDEDGDEPLDSEICALIISAIDAIAEKQGKLEAALAAMGARSDQAEPMPDIDPPIGNRIIEPVEVEPGPMLGQEHRLAGV
jgi:hypothetical protein